MGALKVEVRLDVSGPLADGRADRVLEQWAQNTSQALGDEAVRLLGDFPMDKTGRATGAFKRHLHVTRATRNTVVVRGPTEKGVVWAPWLEGVSERNRSTRFKGYHLFRKTRQQLDEKADEIGQRELDKLLPQIGGG